MVLASLLLPALLGSKPADAAQARNWTFTPHDAAGISGVRQFDATFLRVNGFDSPLGQRYVVLQLPDGMVKSFPLDDLSAADQSYVKSQPVPSYAPETETYRPNYTDYNPRTANTHATAHFVFYWGKNISTDAKPWASASFRQRNFRYFEEIWNFFAQTLHAPMPYAGQATKYKVNVYITKTGLDKYPDGFAFGGESIVMHPGALLEGSSVMPHEFGHVIQFYSGGFRDNADAGWFWKPTPTGEASSFIRLTQRR